MYTSDCQSRQGGFTGTKSHMCTPGTDEACGFVHIHEPGTATAYIQEHVTAAGYVHQIGTAIAQVGTVSERVGTATVRVREKYPTAFAAHVYDSYTASVAAHVYEPATVIVYVRRYVPETVETSV